MKHSESLKEIAAALSAAQAEFKGVAKGGENKFDHYTYAKLEDYVTAVQPVLAKHGLSIIFGADEVIALDDRPTQKGGVEHAVRVKMSFLILHTSGEWIEGSTLGEGQNRGDKATYNAITGARKYGLASALGLATTDDPENPKPDDANANARPQRQAQRPPPQRAAAPRESVDTKSGEVIDYADDSIFKQKISDAYRHRQFIIQQSDSVTSFILHSKQWGNSLDDVPLEHRAEFVNSIRAGKMDHLKTKRGSDVKSPAKREAAHA